MEPKFHYATVSQAVEELRKQGYTLDFTLLNNQLVAGDKAYNAGHFDIADVYRYEGASDPGDEATVYALASTDGVKGILVTGYGASYDDDSAETLKQMHYKYEQAKK